MTVFYVFRRLWLSSVRYTLKLMTKLHQAAVDIFRKLYKWFSDDDSCRRPIRRRQLYDVDSLGRDDFGPGDGNVHEGRGWWVAGQHAGPGYDERSLGLAFVSQDSAACQRQIETARGFIELAVARVYAEKQLRVGSTSPGERLYAVVKNWTHWSPI
ncbi:unnamed protein product [Trichogramma brassicae]|uniref:Peptidoglycan recognition protein family domain-containing protein n=1 Tax=Trichogramma brassicae TaxID=86971 RepID=A0A6H5I5L9_9HYME|nr:unnamed protein product [Trichogramma brassicae]